MVQKFPLSRRFPDEENIKAVKRRIESKVKRSTKDDPKMKKENDENETAGIWIDNLPLFYLNGTPNVCITCPSMDSSN